MALLYYIFNLHHYMDIMKKKACIQKKRCSRHVEKDVQDMNNRINARSHAKRFYLRHEIMRKI